MSREERQSLLHEGISASTTLSAYVEIVFDNSGMRFSRAYFYFNHFVNHFSSQTLDFPPPCRRQSSAAPLD
jgi:hypothetical protein